MSTDRNLGVEPMRGVIELRAVGGRLKRDPVAG
jgi:hypothetical protein